MFKVEANVPYPNDVIQSLLKLSTLGQRVRKLRTIKGWTQKELGKRSNLSQSGVYCIEKEKCKQTRQIISLANAFQVPPSMLYVYNEKKELESKDNNEKEELIKQFLELGQRLSGLLKSH